MAIGQIELNQAMYRIQDITTQKHNENQKPVVDQANFQNTFEKEVDSRVNQVHQGEQAENRQKRQDAKEKGNNEYQGDGGMKRKKPSNPDGRVVPKITTGFDCKI
ncbi:MAG: hypothetical protein MJ134_04810 [Lachnospiraceae bacterium]|nr:hypothetical protein [Lachnospiraceae bacterium]